MAIYTDENTSPFGTGFQTPAGSLVDKELSDRLLGYRRHTARSYRALTAEEVGAIPSTQLRVSPKIDGELWYLVVDNGDVVLVNPRGRVLGGALPVMAEAERLAQRARGRTILAGELWAAPRSGRARVTDLAAAKGGGADAEVKRIAFTPFDLLEGGDDEAHTPIEDYADRLAVIQRLTQGGKRLRAVRTETVGGPGDVTGLFSKWVESGKAEGLVVRPPDGRIFKVKPTIHIDAVVIAYTGRAEDPEQARSLLLALMREDGQYQIIGSLGNLGDDDNRRALLQRLQRLHRPSGYRHASSDGALYRFVEPETVVQLKVSDVQSENSTGDPVMRMVLGYRDDAWTALRMMPGVRIYHPVFERLREDKAVTPTDVRLGQVLERCLVPEMETRAEAVALPASTSVARQVFVKETKGGLAVRKLLAWRTNKDEVDPRYPAYVLHFTDYSPNRKAPLQRTVRLAPDVATAKALFEELMTEKKVQARGWSEVEEQRWLDFG